MPYYAQTKNHTMNQELKKISVVMCTFNGAKYLAEQLDSILAQSYSNIEIIVVDDCSTDNTFEILKNYQSKDPRIQVFQNSKNIGFVQNFSKAISLATGDYIALADQDDIWKPYKLEKFANEIQNHSLIYSDAILIAPDGQSLNRELTRPNDHLVSGHCNQAFLFKNCVSGNTLMFKRELLQYILPIPNVSFHDIWIAFIASSLGTIAYTEEALVVATESRTSSPVRIPRDKETLMHPQIKGFFPCGEGAGYAGGIVSAAMDGEAVAHAVQKYLKED